VLLPELHIVGHQPIRIMPELFGDLVTCLANAIDLFVAFVYRYWFNLLVHNFSPSNSGGVASTGTYKPRRLFAVVIRGQCQVEGISRGW
jgi:hypothetical protein